MSILPNDHIGNVTIILYNAQIQNVRANCRFFNSEKLDEIELPVYAIMICIMQVKSQNQADSECCMDNSV